MIWTLLEGIGTIVWGVLGQGIHRKVINMKSYPGMDPGFFGGVVSL